MFSLSELRNTAKAHTGWSGVTLQFCLLRPDLMLGMVVVFVFVTEFRFALAKWFVMKGSKERGPGEFLDSTSVESRLESDSKLEIWCR